MAGIDPQGLLAALLAGGDGMTGSARPGPAWDSTLDDFDAQELSILDALDQPAEVPQPTSARPSLSNSLPALLGDVILTLANKGRAPAHTGFSDRVAAQARADADRADRMALIEFDANTRSRFQAQRERLNRVRTRQGLQRENDLLDRGERLEEFRHGRDRRERLQDIESERIFRRGESERDFGARVAASMAESGIPIDADAVDLMLEGDRDAIGDALSSMSVERQKQLAKTDPIAAEKLDNARRTLYSTLLPSETGPSELDAAITRTLEGRKRRDRDKPLSLGELAPEMKQLEHNVELLIRAHGVTGKDRDLLMDEWRNVVNQKLMLLSEGSQSFTKAPDRGSRTRTPPTARREAIEGQRDRFRLGVSDPGDRFIR